MIINRIHIFEELLKSINFSRMSLETKSLILHGVITRLHEEGGYSFSTINKILIENNVKGKSSMSRFYKLAIESGKEIDEHAFEKEAGFISDNKENVINQKILQKSSAEIALKAVIQKPASTPSVSSVDTSKQNDFADSTPINKSLAFYDSRPKRIAFRETEKEDD